MTDLTDKLAGEKAGSWIATAPPTGSRGRVIEHTRWLPGDGLAVVWRRRNGTWGCYLGQWAHEKAGIGKFASANEAKQVADKMVVASCRRTIRALKDFAP